MADLSDSNSTSSYDNALVELRGSDNTPIGNNGNRILVDAIISGDQMIKVSSNDQTQGYLGAKIIGTTNKTVVSISNPGGDEDVQINIGSDIFDKSINTTDNITEGTTNLFFTNARARSAISVTDSSSIDFTYSSGDITASVIPGGVDHNSLLNYVANKHIDHSSVSITAGTGLNGGGDITTTRTLNIANTAVTAGSYGSASSVSTFTVNAQGQLTSASNTSISITKSQISDFAHASTHLPNGSDSLTTATAVSLTTSSTNGTGSANSFARSDHTHAVSLIDGEASATSDTTTTSSSDVLINSMTLTPVSGTYLVWFSTSLESSSNNANIYVSIYSGGSQVTHTERVCTPRSQAIPIATQCVVTVNGSQAIEARWRRSGGTATAHQRTLNLIKLSN